MIRLLVTPRQWCLAAMCLALSILLTAAIYVPVSMPTVPIIAPNELPKVDAIQPPFVLPAQSQFAVAAERPVFSASRRPPPVSTGTPVALLPPPRIAVIGVILDSQHRLALIKSAGIHFAAAMTIGSHIAGWTIERIDVHGITLSVGRRSVRFNLASGLRSASMRNTHP